MNRFDPPVATADPTASCTADPRPETEDVVAATPADSEPRVEESVAPPDPASVDAVRLETQLKNGASWFYWIAGLSVVNTAITLFDGQWGFVVGLGVTQVIDALAQVVTMQTPALGFAASAFAVVLDLMVAGLFVLFGWLAVQRKRWAFPVGMTVYAADGLLFVLVQDWFSVGFHAFVLLCIHTGYRALKRMGTE